MTPCFKQHSSHSAFTILELLVSSAILGIVMFVMLAAVDTGMRLWKTTQDRITVDREARAAFSIIAEDLKNMVNPLEPLPQPVFRDPSGGDGVFMEFLVRKPLDYQTQNSTAQSANFGDVCYVRYSFRNGRVYRAFADSEPTFNALRNEQYPGNAPEELLAMNILRVNVGAQGPDGKLGTLPMRSLFYSIEAVEAASLGPGSPPAKNRQYFTSTAKIPVQFPPAEPTIPEEEPPQ
jgi:hypothetical protein